MTKSTEIGIIKAIISIVSQLLESIQTSQESMIIMLTECSKKLDEIDGNGVPKA